MISCAFEKPSQYVAQSLCRDTDRGERCRYANRAQPRRNPGYFPMTKSKGLETAIVLTLAMLACPISHAHAAQCGSSAAGFDTWKSQFAGEARAKGISASTVSALMATHYADATIDADRGQRSFGLSLDQFLAKRGASTIVARGRSLKQSQGALFASIQSALRRAAGPAHRHLGDGDGFWQPARKSKHALVDRDARLRLPAHRLFHRAALCGAAIDRSRRPVAGTRGSMHGEVGQTQFLPKNILAYGQRQSRQRGQCADLRPRIS